MSLRTLSVPAALALLAAQAPAAGPASLPAAPMEFDGRRLGPGPEGSGRPGLPPEVPEAEGKALGILDDLESAHARWGNEAQIRKLPASSGHEPKSSFTLAVIGDAEPGRFPWERIFTPGLDAYRRQLRGIHALGPSLIVQLGDFVSEGDAENYRDYVRFLDKEVRIPLLSVIGNHDRSAPNGDADKRFYRAVFGEPDFYADYNGWRLVCLDTADRRLTRRQLEWLGRALDTGLRKAVFTHVPPAFIEGKIKSPEAEKGAEGPAAKSYIGDFFTAYFEEGSKEFRALVSARGVSRVYVAHIHAFGVADDRGVRYVLTGGGGSPLYPLPPWYPQRMMAHFILAEFGPQGVRETVYPLDEAPFPLP